MRGARAPPHVDFVDLVQERDGLVDPELPGPGVDGGEGLPAHVLAKFSHPETDDTLPRRILPGSEVIVPALTWSTTIWPVLQAGAKPVFVDCDPYSLQMRPEAIEVEECAAPNGSYSLSLRLVKPDSPPTWRRVRMRARRPVMIL